MRVIIRTMTFVVVFSTALAALAYYAEPPSRAELCAGAERGDAFDQLQLGLTYYLGEEGVQPDYAAAAYWYRAAADQGVALAQIWLGDLYREGQGVAQDYAEAMGWYQAEGMTAEQIADAQRMSRELWDQLESESRD